jgi:hypothetical protein
MTYPEAFPCLAPVPPLPLLHNSSFILHPSEGREAASASPYQFDIIEPEILGRIYERFLGDYWDTRPKAKKPPSTGRERAAPLPPREVNSLGSTLTPSRGLTALGLTPDSGESGAIRLTEGHRAKVELGQEFNPKFGAPPTGVCGIFELAL